MAKQRKIIISGGGSGGHIFPAIAIANALKQIDDSILDVDIEELLVEVDPILSTENTISSVDDVYLNGDVVERFDYEIMESDQFIRIVLPSGSNVSSVSIDFTMAPPTSLAASAAEATTAPRSRKTELITPSNPSAASHTTKQPPVDCIGIGNKTLVVNLGGPIDEERLRTASEPNAPSTPSKAPPVAIAPPPSPTVPVRSIHLRYCYAVKQTGFSRIGVTHQRNRWNFSPTAGSSPLFTLLSHLTQAFQYCVDTHP